MFTESDNISIRQLQSLIALFLFGTSAVYLPAIAASIAGQDGWISVVIAVLFAVICVYLLMSVSVVMRGKIFHDSVCLLLSKPIGKLVCLVLAARLIAGAALELRIFGEIVKGVLLPQTPYFVVSAVMTGLAFMSARKQYAARGRAAQILCYVVFIPLIALLVFAAVNVDFTNLMPVLRSTPDTLLRGGYESGIAFGGLEILIAAAPFVAGDRVKARKRAVSAVFFTGLLLTAATALTIARFKPSGVHELSWPLLDTLFQATIPGAFMERHNAIVMLTWITTAFAVYGAGLFIGSHLIRDTCGMGKRDWYIIGCIIAIYTISHVPNDLPQAQSWSRTLYNYSTPILAFVLPLLLYIIARVRRLAR